MKISEILTPSPQCITPECTVTMAAERMRLLDVGMLPICDKDRLVGSVTDRDITIRATACGANPNSTLVRDVMTKDITCCYEDEDIEQAAKQMEERQIRRLPVLNRDKRLIGIVSLGDIAVRTHREKLAGEVLERVSEPAAMAG